MFTHHSSSFHLHCIIISLHLLLLLPCDHAQDFKTYYENCYKNFSCGGRIKEIGYPFWGGDRPYYCGLPSFKLSCKDDEFAVLDTGLNYTFRVFGIDQTSHEIKISRGDLQADSCPSQIFNGTLDKKLFDYGAQTEDLNMFYNCSSDTKIRPENPSLRDNATCTSRDSGLKDIVFFGNESFPVYHFDALISCKVKIVVPVDKTVVADFKRNATKELDELLNPSFDVYYKMNDYACNACKSWGGLCWSGFDLSKLTCLCQDGAYDHPCKQGKKMGVGVKIAIALCSLAFGIGLTAFAFCFYIRRKKAEHGSFLVSQNISSYEGSISDSEKGGTYMGVPIFSYADLEKATNSFDSSREVGDGGFGSVYKGKLQDGRVVAVKRLYENNFKRVEQFMNEVEILTRLRHKNLVPLYGCTSQHCRQLLLVYEYVPNGTIADHLYGSRAKPGKLTWKTRMKIATETASALSYLHASDVIHRDVKTTNILLDNNFSVKVADFGLSRLFPLDVTHVSTAPQGTPGYVDPEYHECYQLTDKSDVYSFGVVMIELISSMPAVDISRHRHEINLSNMAMNKIQNGALQELVDTNLGFATDSDIRNMITEVAELAFQCLQNGREFRPTMKKVYEVLLGIQSKYYGTVKTDVLGDDSSLLKDESQILSPNSVTANWVSRSTTASSTT
ncbi:LEAF RUST 10 DISEASE-RESISTANCE LOCUS RECEPTOR-LIKE PROTEIN KINASE-like 1.2 isoform X2 [Daucus carota subsp. sativus]|uniref:LEAF RUST 10 DISEASE-RESISTANCE LOCUS RECEPTOR-LIKE PROTEIN KINASE-like 1.2 isoform X2 n=1 Tax=Daucus carota subsp. sativus TaxID=79200 RepID=UPI0007EF1A88|nr:PREDICTED: LEAF RUST 10 DISEASE-RESISTANCE LOCUS RECEPTOR-LIKE PROTEIN KINASE-like 1.2 isoform X2 [Daucus carota subsp. sativus]